MNKRMRMGMLSAGMLVVLSSPLIYATTVRRMDTAELAKHSGLIVQGIVLGNEVVFDQGPNGPLNVRTLTTVQVSRTFKGPAAQTVTVAGPGGRVEDLSYNWPGVPRFKGGEEVILFLTQPKGDFFKGGLMVTGLEQGRLTVARMPDGTRVIKQNFAELKFPGGANRIDSPQPKPLDTAIAQIEEIVRVQRAAAGQGQARP